ncbi:SDR family oxidoreductase [Metabacillus idriensis]|uniref:SDR family oxidoreductase n=1 Tax=Metabacillus idriensis TaxID=324768 RepID=UPI00281434B1|nr:SDR family oxidoreductase [Metabacillus idriensis]MDR0139055.1 SDR family oxidoreductase [Metabacillus idriensis]
MKDKKVIITGANSGMGLAAAIEMANKGAHVIMACRSLERGQAALDQAKRESKSNAIELMRCDLGSLLSIREFAKQYNDKYHSLDVLINNAGVVTIKRELTEDGFESMMGVNHLGHFLLTRLLLPALKQSPQGRIVNVSSGAHKIGNIHFDDPYLTKGFTVWKGYSQSKLANLLYTAELAKKLQGTGVTVNALHPGAVATSLGVNRQTGFGKGVYALLKPFFLTPEQGAQTAIYLAESPEVEHVTGQYFYKRKIELPTERARDMDLAAKFWEWSEKEVELDNKKSGSARLGNDR